MTVDRCVTCGARMVECLVGFAIAANGCIVPTTICRCCAARITRGDRTPLDAIDRVVARELARGAA